MASLLAIINFLTTLSILSHGFREEPNKNGAREERREVIYYAKIPLPGLCNCQVEEYGYDGEQYGTDSCPLLELFLK